MSDNKEDLTPTYIGRKPCGCVVFAMVDEPNPTPQYRKDLAKELARCIRQGLEIERVTVEYVRNLSSIGCKCGTHKDKEIIPTKQGVMELTNEK